MSQIIGTCGNCGGPVTCEPYLSTIPQKPSCKQCGATVAAGFGPVLPMDSAKVLFGDVWELSTTAKVS